MTVALLDEALAELHDAAVWYDSRRAGLGDEFVTAVRAALKRIDSSPQGFPAWPGLPKSELLIYRCLLDRFPYALAFQRHQEGMVVIAIAHAKRRPLYWAKRTRP